MQTGIGLKTVILCRNCTVMKIKKSRRRIKLRYIAYGVIVSYIIMCQSCMTMRMTPKETKAFFEKSKTDFVSKTADFKNHKIHYVMTGKEDNPTLFFIHGSPGSWDAYKEYMKDSLLLKRYRMVSIDRPGFGYSDFGDAQDVETQAKWITEFFKMIDNGKPVTLVGHSMGGPIVVKMAILSPKQYYKLIILAGSVDPDAETAENWRPILRSKPMRYLVPGAFRPSNDELWWLKGDLIEMKPQLKDVISEVIIVHGTKDRLVPYKNMAFMQKEFVNAKKVDTVSIKDADHFIPWTNFEDIRKVLLD